MTFPPPTKVAVVALSGETLGTLETVFSVLVVVVVNDCERMSGATILGGLFTGFERESEMLRSFLLLLTLPPANSKLYTVTLSNKQFVLTVLPELGGEVPVELVQLLLSEPG